MTKLGLASSALAAAAVAGEDPAHVAEQGGKLRVLLVNGSPHMGFTPDMENLYSAAE